MRFSVVALGVIGAIVPSLPVAAAHETHLAYLPNTKIHDELNSYLVCLY